jgi:hypothetical protein
MDEKKIVTEILLDIHKDVGALCIDVAAVKADLREHMKRTAMLETEIKWLHSQVWLAKGAIAFIALAGIIVGMIKVFI